MNEAGPAPILGSMRPDGSRLKVHPADVRGRWLTRRRAVFAALIAIYVLAPLVPVGGHPSIMLDVQHRRFYLFGQTFNAQDFWMVVLIALAFVFGLLAVTAWRGRLWCGWACPQTVFLEGVYRPIERLLEGRASAGSSWSARPGRRDGSSVSSPSRRPSWPSRCWSRTPRRRSSSAPSSWRR